MTLIRKNTANHYGKPDWGENDFVVLDNGQVVGRIMLHPQAPKAQPWMWTITACDMPPSTHNHGYAGSLDDCQSEIQSSVEREIKRAAN